MKTWRWAAWCAVVMRVRWIKEAWVDGWFVEKKRRNGLRGECVCGKVKGEWWVVLKRNGEIEGAAWGESRGERGV